MWKKATSQGGSDPASLQASPAEGAILDVHGDSKVGRLRTINQDRFFIMSFMLKAIQEPSEGIPPEAPTRATGYLIGVADGVGGAPAGERASLLAVGTLKAF